MASADSEVERLSQELRETQEKLEVLGERRVGLRAHYVGGL